MLKFSIYVFVSLFIISVSPTAEARVCYDIFPLDYFRQNPQAQELTLESHRLAEQLSKTNNKAKELWLSWKIRSLHHKFSDLFPLPDDHPGPLFIWSYFYPEPFWPTLFIHGRFRARVWYLDEPRRRNLEYEWTEQGVKNVQTGEPLRGPKHWIVVIGLDRKIYLSHDIQQLPIYFCHSSFFAGMPVLFAGAIEFERDGTVSLLSNNSGHYHPSSRHLNWAATYMRSLGFKIPDSAIHPY